MHDYRRLRFWFLHHKKSSRPGSRRTKQKQRASAGCAHDHPPRLAVILPSDAREVEE